MIVDLLGGIHTAGRPLLRGPKDTPESCVSLRTFTFGHRPSATGLTERRLRFVHIEFMWRHPLLKSLLGAYIVWGAWNWFIDRPEYPADGLLAPDEPLQFDPASHTTERRGRWTLTPRASYKITARILGVERYRFDALASLVPEDLALGWGPLSDNRTLRTLSISQSNRFYYWRFTGAPILSKDVIVTHSANTHVIPADAGVARQLSRLRRGQVVTLTGELVDGVRDDGGSIRTSLVRTDTGAGACEVMLVQTVGEAQ